MKMIGGYFTEIANIILVIEAQSSTEIVEKFIAMGILADIDNIIGQTLQDVEIDKECASANIEYKNEGDIENTKDILTAFKNQDINVGELILSLFGLFFYKLIRFIYFILYYYF